MGRYTSVFIKGIPEFKSERRMLARQQKRKGVPSKEEVFKKAWREYFSQNRCKVFDMAQKGKDEAGKTRSCQITRPCMLGTLDRATKGFKIWK